MCLGVPGKVVEWIDRDPTFARAQIEFDGVNFEIKTEDFDENPHQTWKDLSNIYDDPDFDSRDATAHFHVGMPTNITTQQKIRFAKVVEMFNFYWRGEELSSNG